MSPTYPQETGEMHNLRKNHAFLTLGRDADQRFSMAAAIDYFAAAPPNTMVSGAAAFGTAS